jgi:hypothetical protein
MSWKAIPNGTEVDLVGPVGDTLELVLSSTSPDYTWTGWTWTGQVRATADAASTVGTFTFTDSSTSTVLALNAQVSAATTGAWTGGDTIVYSIVGTKSSTVVTFVSGKVVPQLRVTR